MTTRRFAAVWPWALDRPADRVAESIGGWRVLDDQRGGWRSKGREIGPDRAAGGAAARVEDADGGAVYGGAVYGEAMGDAGDIEGDVGDEAGRGLAAGGMVESGRAVDAGRPGGESPLPATVLGPFNPGRRGVRALVVLAVAVIVVAGFLAWRSRPRADPIGPPASMAPATSTSARTVVVAVQGKVRKPGLVTLPAGARVADAVNAAGGALPGTDLTGLNLARKLIDGELIVVGVVPSANHGGGIAGGKVNINLADAGQLDALPGIGPALASRIITYRTQHGAFAGVSDLRKVPGIGDAKFAEIKDLVTV